MFTLRKEYIKSFLLVCIFILNGIFPKSIAQDTISNLPHQITLKWPFWRLDGKKIHRSKLGFEILKVEAAVPWYQKSKNNETKAYLAMGSAAILAILGSPETDITSPRFGKNNLGYSIGSLVAGGVSIFFYSRARKFLKKAVRIYNEHQLIY